MLLRLVDVLVAVLLARPDIAVACGAEDLPSPELQTLSRVLLDAFVHRTWRYVVLTRSILVRGGASAHRGRRLLGDGLLGRESAGLARGGDLGGRRRVLGHEGHQVAIGQCLLLLRRRLLLHLLRLCLRLRLLPGQRAASGGDLLSIVVVVLVVVVVVVVFVLTITVCLHGGRDVGRGSWGGCRCIGRRCWRLGLRSWRVGVVLGKVDGYLFVAADHLLG